mmetsp:Transcript_42755/g.31252  ORF Transcript_42755/g.31252 Transcript_42755/m.31252 type:complete len:83 (+) Transcript_42755:2-250(+)
MSQDIQKADLSKLNNFISVSKFGEVQQLKWKIESLESENQELKKTISEMNEFKQATELEWQPVDRRRFFLLKSQVIQLTRHN